MLENLKIGEINQINAGTQVLDLGETVSVVCLIMKGRVILKGNNIQVTLGSGNFLGVYDLFRGTYQASCRAIDNVMLYAFPVKGIRDLEQFLSSKKEYPGIVVGSTNKYIGEVYKIHGELLAGAKRLHNFLLETYQQYQQAGKQSGYSIQGIPGLESLNEFEYNSKIPQELLLYYRACMMVPADVQKIYYGTNRWIYMHHIKEQSQVTAYLLKEVSKLGSTLAALFELLLSEEKASLFYGFSQLAEDILGGGKKSDELLAVIDSIIDMINDTELLINKRIGISVSVNRERMEQIYYNLLEGDKKKKDVSQETESNPQEQLDSICKNSLARILDYSCAPDEIRSKFADTLHKFNALKDKTATDEGSRKVRKELSKAYYVIYEAVLKRVIKEKNQEKLYEWFLNYGFVDETLLNQQQLMSLYEHSYPSEQVGPCRVYTMCQWLTAIYKGEKEPSKNEFDLDYKSNLREQRKSNAITEEQLKEYEKDFDRKLAYEINNMLVYNNRIVSGQASVFVPILYEENFPGYFERSIQTAQKVNQIIQQLVDIDYSVFYRETVYSDPEHGIKREYIQKEAYPDILLLPVNGTGGSMWQDISDRVRTSSGRFLIPIMMENSLEDVMIQLFGRFRWELCRTIQGATWNNIQYPSLTSEYCDYLQFYRKNRDLTEDKKEKLKLQMQRARGSSRETFVLDYVTWVRFESQGSIRLNKVAREILATYCPFSKEIRSRILNQPLFAEAMERGERERRKKIREWEVRFRVYEKDKIEIPDEINKTAQFYSDL